MASKKGLYPPIFRIDVDAARAYFGDEVSLEDIPRRIVGAYNTGKDVTTYEQEGAADFDGCRLVVYRNARARPQPSPWVPFYEPYGIAITKVSTQSQHFIGFIVVDGELYAHTGGHSVVVFERFIDVAFPIEVARRIAEPEVKRARSSQISGTTLASDVNFRDPRRITYTESLENVWTALSGQVRPVILAEPGLRAVFGAKDKMRLEVSSAIKFGPRVDTLDKLITLIRWLAATAESPLPDDDDWAILDSIKGHCCIKAKGVLAVSQVKTQAPQVPWRTITNRAFECLLRGFWSGEWITSGDLNAQCNSASQATYTTSPPPPTPPAGNWPAGVSARAKP